MWLTEGLDRRASPAQGSTAKTGGGVRGGAQGQVGAGLLRAYGGTARLLVALRSGTRGQRAQVIVGGEKSRRRNDSPAAMVRARFRRCKGLDRGRGARGGSLGRGESTGGHGVAGAAAERCGRGGAARRHGGAVLARWLGLVAALGVEGEGSGGPQGPIKGWNWGLGVRARDGRARRSRRGQRLGRSAGASRKGNS